MTNVQVTGLPATIQTWPLYGAGVENMGRHGLPVDSPIPLPAADQLLVRVDAVSLCFSDVKVLRLGGEHPRLYHRDLPNNPTILGHEVSLTIVSVGESLQDRYQVGQRITLQPDVYYQGKGLAYGYAIPGGLTQYHLIGREILEGDEGNYAIAVPANLGFSEVALTEPWACVEAAYTQRRRLHIKTGGVLWVVGQISDTTTYHLGETFARGLPVKIVLTDVPQPLAASLAGLGVEIITRNGLAPSSYADLAAAETGGGFDDIIALGFTAAGAVAAIAQVAAPRATINLVGELPLDGLVSLDVGRIHYDYLAYLGTRGTDIGAAYGSRRNRSELRPGGILWIMGAGGPMGRMHLQRALEMANGPRRIVATDISNLRLDDMQRSFAPLAKERCIELISLNPETMPPAEYTDALRTAGEGRGFDDVLVMVPVAPLVESAVPHLAVDGMLLLFAGIAKGTMARLNLSPAYLGNLQITGTSGSNIQDQLLVIKKTIDGQLSPANVVAAIGGMNVAGEGMKAMVESRFPGKIVIYPQVASFPLTPLPELQKVAPAVFARLDATGNWTRAAENEFLRLYAEGNGGKE